MKLLLCSEGFYTPAEIAKTEELVGKPKSAISVAVINEGYAVEHNNNLTWVLDNLSSVRDNFGGESELVNLLALDPQTIKERIQKHDAIFVVGGHTDYLMSVFNKTGFSKMLPELLKTKVYIGSSAGSMVVGKRISTTVYRKIYGDEGTYGTTQYAGIVDFAVVPHLNSPIFFNRRKETLQQGVKDYNGTVYGLSDGSAIVVDGDNTYILGDKAVKIVDGRIV